MGFVHIRGFDKYIFGDDVQRNDTKLGRTLYINVPDETSEKEILKKFFLLDGKLALVAYETNK